MGSTPDSSRFPDGGIVLLPRSGALPATGVLNGIVQVGNTLYRWDGAAWISLVTESPAPQLVFVKTKADFPAAAGGVITLADNVTYYVIDDVDLTGDRLVAGQNTAIVGGSSENSGLRSTGLVGTALITSAYSLPMRNLFITADVALNLDAGAVPNIQALDWTAVNFVDCGSIGRVANYNNFIVTASAFLESGDLALEGTINTVSFMQCLLNPPPGQTAVTVDAGATIGRRLRLLYSAVLVLPGETGISAQSASFPTNETYILDNVSFSGGGTYLSGLTHVDNAALFSDCTGIANSGNSASYYMVGNATGTTCTLQNTFYKVAGTTTAGAYLEKFTLSANRATYVGALQAYFKVTAFLSLSGPANNQIGVRVAVGGTTATSSEMRATMNAAGRVESVSVQHVVFLTNGQYIEVFLANQSGAGTTVTASELNVVVEQLS